LAENKDLPTTETRLTEIIKQHSNRINAIIEDIMQISRGHVASPDSILLKPWLQQFMDSFCLGSNASHDCFEFDMTAEDLSIVFDAGHLNRILTNLCHNAKMHGNADLPITIKVYTDNKNAVCIEVDDQGEGISPEERDKIFEPFYTTNHKGSGLGLYIVSQLCELNDASIDVSGNEFEGTSFTLKK